VTDEQTDTETLGHIDVHFACVDTVVKWKYCPGKISSLW